MEIVVPFHPTLNLKITVQNKSYANEHNRQKVEKFNVFIEW